MSDLYDDVDGDLAEIEGIAKARALVEASSLGTPDAKALRATVSDYRARQIVKRAKELGTHSREARALLEAGKVNHVGPPTVVHVLGQEIQVRYNSYLVPLGRQGAFDYNGVFDPLVIELKEWNERVFLHELLHLLMGYPHLFEHDEPDATKPISETAVQIIEDALWDMGWRMTGGQA